MPRYYFDTDDGDRRSRDEVGLDLPDMAAVAAEAFGLLRDMVQDRLPEGRRVLTAQVRDGDGAVVYRGEMTVEGQRFSH